MSWIAVGAAAIGLVTSVSNNKAKAKAQQKQADISAAQTQYSPWTGQQAQEFNPQAIDGTGDALKGVAGGAFSGIMSNNANAAMQPDTSATNPMLAGDPNNPWSQMGGMGAGNQYEQMMKKKTIG